jgi:hypothetical protein
VSKEDEERNPRKFNYCLGLRARQLKLKRRGSSRLNFSMARWETRVDQYHMYATAAKASKIGIQ